MSNYYTDLDNDLGQVDEANDLCDALESECLKSQYEKNKKAKTGELIHCPVCSNRFKKKSYQQAFCSNKGRNNCKDRYWNFTDQHRKNRAVFFK